MEFGTDVDPTGVMTYGAGLMDLVETFTTGLSEELSDISESQLGRSGLSEALMTGQYHAAVMQQLLQLTTDLGTGVSALSQGAITIGANYLRADDEQRREMSITVDAFTPRPGQHSLQQEQARQAAGQQASEEGIRDEVGAATVPLPEATDTTPERDSNPQNSTDAERAALEHQETYGDDERKYDGRQVAPGEEPQAGGWSPLTRWADDQLTQ